MTTLKITQIGNSLGVILPKEVLAMLNADKGDTLFFSRTPDGIALSHYDPKIARQMEVARKIMREDREVLKKLAE
ncbi:MAG: AbrB/MazE/SpoVT family DNA-binding domain-containing protein [Alphaproteobacteria bacterium]|nr:AbrB/MazE/SpoVT family DNA-binding domain-containing protein [Alphaproteobacteria bacterium]